jgi:hypothetical protein
MPGLRGMNTENEIATGLVDFVIQFNRKFQSDQGGLSVFGSACVIERSVAQRRREHVTLNVSFWHRRIS